MRGFALLLAALSIASPALSAQTVTLRANTVDADGNITLGELFEGAGAAGSQIIAYRTGPQALLNAAAVQGVAARAGLTWSNPDGIRRIVVRDGVAQAERPKHDVLTYARSLQAGETVLASDLVWAKAVSAPSDAPGDADAIIGMAAKRPLREGQAVSARDVTPPMVIKANELITVTYDYQGVTLALQAKAMAPGAVGATIAVQNTTSQKIVQAVVVGPGQALVGPNAQMAAMPARPGSAVYASR